MATSFAEKAPMHLWAVGIVSLLWNAFGCFIYTMTMMRDPATMAAASPEMRAAIEASPDWANGAWAVGVWFALLGSALLLLRKGWAFYAFAISLLGLLGTAIYEFTSGMPVNIPQLAMIWAVALFLLWYSWTMRQRGVLR